ncbi:MAG: acetoacetate decarboxylase family protein [Chloroflexi bacterium]|nr:acetoacetate decarboxylase family protein [Chloroflexota bacterium]
MDETDPALSASGEMNNSERLFEIEGRTLGFPSLYPDASSALGLFLVPSRTANELIKDSGFEVAQALPGRAIFSLSCVDYRDSDCGPYREISMAFFVKKYGRSIGIPYLGTWLDIARDRAATFIWKLPVTTRTAYDAGVLMWGLPKTIDEIDFNIADENATFDLNVEGRKVLSYTVRAVGKDNQPRGRSALYSIYEGSPHVTYLSHEYRDMGRQFRGGDLQLGDHPIADKLRGLGLPRKPLIAVWIGKLALEVDAPEKL